MFAEIIQEPQRFVAHLGFLVASSITGLLTGAWAYPVLALMG